MLVRMLVMAIALCGLSLQLSAEDSIETLKLKIEQLEAKLTLADKTIELLQKQCEILEKENVQLKRMEGAKPDSPKTENSNPSEPNVDNDAFRVGVVWVGEAKINGNVGKWAISVSERNGKNLTAGVITQAPDGKRGEFALTGSAPASGDGPVVLETPLVGRAKIFMRGRIQNGEIALALSGTGRLGDKLAGAATLRPKN